MKICPNCKKEYDDNFAFCVDCGIPLEDVKILIEEPQDETPTVKYCMRCGKQLNTNAAFCSACGAPANSTNSVSAKPVINVNDYINKIKTNKNVTGFIGTLKKYIKNPAEALNETANEGNIATTVISSVALLISIIIFFMCFYYRINEEFYLGQTMFNLCMVVAVFMALAFVLIPALTTFAAVKLSGKDYNFKRTVSAAAVNTLYLVPFFIVSGLISFVSFEAGIVLFAVTVIVKVFLSISELNIVAGNILNSVKTLWASVGIATVLNAIVISICGSILADLLEEIIYDLIFGSLW